MNSFGNLIKSCRVNRKWSLRKVAGHVGVEYTTIEAWEKGRHEPRLGHAAKIAKLYQISLDTVMELNYEV